MLYQAVFDTLEINADFSMFRILAGSSEHMAHMWRKTGTFKNNSQICDHCPSNAMYRSNFSILLYTCTPIFELPSRNIDTMYFRVDKHTSWDSWNITLKPFDGNTLPLKRFNDNIMRNFDLWREKNQISVVQVLL